MKPHVIAHRGDSAHRPENTLASFASALELGAGLVEFDVQLTRDGEPVVIHDATVDRTTDGRGRVAELSLAELRRLSAGYPERFGPAWAGERVPTLAEVLAFVKGRARALIEIKRDAVSDDALGGVEALTLAAVRKAGLLDDVAVLSFDPRVLARCRGLEPGVPCGLLYLREEPAVAVARAQEMGARLLLPEKGALSLDLRDRARAAGLMLATWVVDDPAELEGLAPYELYGLASNRPGVLLEALAD